MSDCKERMLKFDYEARMKYYKNKFVNNTGVEIDPNLFTNALQDRAKYHKFAAMCVNLDLKKRYELSAQTDIIYCQRNIDDPRDEVGKSLNAMNYEWVFQWHQMYVCCFLFFLQIQLIWRSLLFVA